MRDSKNPISHLLFVISEDSLVLCVTIHSNLGDSVLAGPKRGAWSEGKQFLQQPHKGGR